MNVHNTNFIGTLMPTFTLVVSLLLAGFTEVAESQEMQMGGSSANANATAQTGNDPGLAYLSGLQASQYSRVGRLAVQLIRDGAMQQVPFDWAFHTNDEFRFMIASNRDGWLYILHRSPGGQLQLLYPPPDPNTGQVGGNSRVMKNEYFLVPQPTEGSFVFETDTGEETFFLVIKDRPEPPALSDIIPDNQSPPQPQNVPGPQYQQQYQAPATAPASQYPSQPQSAWGSQSQQQYQTPATAPASQYPPQPQSVGGPQYQQQYQAPGAVPVEQYPPQPQSAGGPQYQQQYQAPATAPADQYPPQRSRHQLRQQLQEVALDTFNYSVIPKAVKNLAGAKKLTGQRYRGVRFKPAQGTDPGTYFAPQPNSELQDAWFVFKLNHVD